MKIKALKLTNFRGYEDTVSIDFSDLTAIVGKNDIGKSTILEALDIFFNDGKGSVKIEKSDVNIHAASEQNNEISISVIFIDLPKAVVIDTAYQTSLRDEYLLNSDGLLEVTKKYANGGAAKTFIKAVHPTSVNCADLLLKKNADLKKIIQTCSVVCDNQAINSVMRRAIWRHFSDSLDLKEIEIEVTKEDAKKIWDKLAGYLPVYSLFQSDRKNSDNDSEVQDPLKEAVKQILSDAAIKNSLDQVAETVQQKLSEVSSRTLEKLREMDPTVANSLNPILPSANNLKWVDVFKNVSIVGDDIPINKRGSGVKRLILLNFFRAEAERVASDNNNANIIYAIEEPETSQHEVNQTLLIHALQDLSQTEKAQVIVTTHSSTIVKELSFEDLRLIEEENGQKVIHNIRPGQLCYPSLNEVNYVAFEEVTIEYFNELYGFLEYNNWFSNYAVKQPKRLYKKERNGNVIEQQICLAEYIRHQIHHPENHNNPIYTKEELAEATKSIRDYIQACSEQKE